MVNRFQDRIIVYEDIFPQDIRVFINGRRGEKGLTTRIPVNPSVLVKTTAARINWGRWIVDCPGGCTDAVLASSEYPVFVCSMPFCEEKGYIRIVFPTNRIDIEEELLKRPVHASGLLIHANWNVGETIENLKRELEILDNLPRSRD